MSNINWDGYHDGGCLVEVDEAHLVKMHYVDGCFERNLPNHSFGQKSENFLTRYLLFDKLCQKNSHFYCKFYQ